MQSWTIWCAHSRMQSWCAHVCTDGCRGGAAAHHVPEVENGVADQLVVPVPVLVEVGVQAVGVEL